MCTIIHTLQTVQHHFKTINKVNIFCQYKYRLVFHHISFKSYIQNNDNILEKVYKVRK